MAKVIGAIFYTYLGDGCITGKYQENGLNPQTESLTKIKKDGIEDATNANAWVGEYTATWTEGNTKAVNGKVIITAGSTNGVLNNEFLFEWKIGTDTIFFGHGMRVSNNQLVVCYWNDEANGSLSDIFDSIKKSRS